MLRFLLAALIGRVICLQYSDDKLNCYTEHFPVTFCQSAWVDPLANSEHGFCYDPSGEFPPKPPFVYTPEMMVHNWWRDKHCYKPTQSRNEIPAGSSHSCAS